MDKSEKCATIFQTMFEKYKIPTNISDFSDYIELVSELSDTDIECIVLRAYGLALERGKEIDDEILRKTINAVIFWRQLTTEKVIAIIRKLDLTKNQG